MQGKNIFNNIKNQLGFILFVSLIVAQVPVHACIVHKHSIQCIKSASIQCIKSAILPHLMYCQKVWHFARASDKLN